MSHEIEKLDSIVSLEPCWHGLEVIEPQIVWENSRLTWEVEQQPLSLPNGQKVDGFAAIVCKDNQHMIHVAKESYRIIQNSRIWEIVNNSLGGVKYKVAVAGSLGNRRKVFISVALEGESEYFVHEDKLNAFLTFASSHDESMALEAFDSNIRVVCANTLRAARGSKGKMNVRVQHSGDVGDKIVGMEAKIVALLEFRKDFYGSLVRLMDKPVSVEDAERIVAGYIAEDSDKYSTRAKNQVEEIVNLFQRGLGNHGKNRYDLLNGVTEFYTHHAASNIERGALSNEFGSYADQNQTSTLLC
jgi:phage/plasmid-like protein (TIGR03299 family)